MTKPEGSNVIIHPLATEPSTLARLAQRNAERQMPGPGGCQETSTHSFTSLISQCLALAKLAGALEPEATVRMLRGLDIFTQNFLLLLDQIEIAALAQDQSTRDKPPT